MRQEPSQELVESIKSAIGMSGMLFSAHPEHSEWDTTRPGARPGEVADFVRKVEDERKSYISVVFHAEGETDEDEWEWEKDCYEVILNHKSGAQERDIAETPERAAEVVATYMANH